MHLKFKRLKIHNFLSFSDSDVILNDSGYTLVSGTNNCKLDSAKSNGSGKSSLFESIIWCLTGDTIRGTKDVVNRFGSDGTFVELNFEIDSTTYKLIRYKEYSNIGTNLKIYINDEDKSGKGIRDSEKLLEQYLPDLTSSLIGSVIILGQGLPQRFTNNTPAGRKEILEKLSKSDFMIEDIKEKLNKRKSYLNSEFRALEDNILELTSKKSVYELELDKSKQELEQLTNKPAVDYTNELTDLDINISFNESELALAEAKVNETNENLQTSRVKYSSLDSELKSKQFDIANKYDRSDLVKDRYKLTNRINQLEKSIEDAKNIKDTCPTCGQKLLDVHVIDTTDLEEELIKLKEDDVKLLSAIELSKESENKELLQLQESYKYLKDSLLQEGQSCRQLYDNALNHKNNLTKLISELKLQKQTLINDRDNFINNISKLENNINSIATSIDQITNKILYNNIEKDNMQSRLDIVTRMLTIATRDFRGFLLSEVINFINQKSKEYCKEIFNTEEVEFKLDGNNIFIGYCGKQYENLSGGEKQKIDLIIQFSIRDMLSKFLNFSSNILVIDEVFDNLDSIGCQNVLNLISNKLTDMTSLFIITHHTDIDIPFDNEILIVKDESGISKVV